MQRLITFILGIIVGIVVTLWYLQYQKDKEIHIQSNTIRQNIRMMNKMVVAEANFNEVYSYNDSDKYLFDLLEFDKNIILLVDAKAQISYDLSRMKIELDSVHKIITINDIPPEQVEIFPSIRYYDMQQSSFNQFTKDDLNKVNAKAIEQIKEHINLSELRLKAKKQLLQNLQNLYFLSKVYGWKIKDNHLMQNLKSDLLLQ
jgi:hypothetical protein